MKVTPILYMEAIEPSLKFWVDRLGFKTTLTMPDGDRLGFAILENGSSEVMLQTSASAAADMTTLGAFFAARPKSVLFIEVDDFAGVVKRLEGIQPAMPVRQTDYGMTEIGILEPGGNLVVFATRTSQ